MKYIFLILIFTSSVFAEQSVVDIYQKGDIKAVEKFLDIQLTSKKYWNYKLQNIDTKFGYFENINYILACDKSKTSLKLYAKDKNNNFKLDDDFSAFIGKKDGDKQREGDLKTPIGVYKILQKLSKVDAFYGPLAFVTSYPNVYDKAQGKNGHGIWVHGLPLDEERDDYTKGCIAINNKNLKHIEKRIDFQKAFVYIDKEKFLHVEKKNLVTILSELYKWRLAWKNSDIETYLNFYNKNFKRDDGLNLNNFKRYKTRVFAKKGYKQIFFTDVNVIPYPMQNKENVYLITFHEEYKSSTYKFSGEKELYISLKDNKFSILAEK